MVGRIVEAACALHYKLRNAEALGLQLCMEITRMIRQGVSTEDIRARLEREILQVTQETPLSEREMSTLVEECVSAVVEYRG